jgi:hypothetical protein
LRCQGTAGAGAVLHKNLLTEFLAEAAGKNPRGDVSRTTGAEADHQPNILIGGSDLRMRRKRPSNGPAAQIPNELASSHKL